MTHPPHPSAPAALPPSPLVGEGRGPRPQVVGRVRGNADGLTRRQQRPPLTVTKSRKLRQDTGEPERRLWRALREAFPDIRFRRQVPFGPYHADFCAHALHLIVDVDGDDHATKIKQDAARARFLATEGCHVIRFANADVMDTIDGVVQPIAAAIAHKQKGRP
jgi:very-short-patch-repair endonuclease